MTQARSNGAADGRINYLAALYERPVAVLLLVSGEALRLARLGLGRHFQLQALGREIVQVPLQERVEALRKWLIVAGVEDPGKLALADLPGLIRAIKALNAPRGHLAWETLPPPLQDVPERAVDYSGRALARIVDTLARHYGWSLEQIVELPPEVALAHLQECILADRRRRDWEHYLSEIAWEYDKRSKKSHYRPMPPLPWEALPAQRKYTPVPEWVKEKYYPKGVVIDLTDVGRARGAAGPGR